MTCEEKVLYMFLGAIYLIIGFMTGFALSVNTILGIIIMGLDIIPVTCSLWYVLDEED